MSQEPVQLVANERRTQLTGPFTYHVYLGCSFWDAFIIDNLRRRLQEMRIECFSRFNPDTLEIAFQSLIKQGTSRSQKCLIYVTDAYITELASNDERAYWCKFELKKVLEKASRISRDVIVVLKSKGLTIPSELMGCTTMEVTKEIIEEDVGFLNLLVQKLLEEPNAELVTMPKQNIGYGSALGYFYGFLRLVLPDFRRRLVEETLAGEDVIAKNTVKKMLIIMPESCFCPAQFPEEFSHTNKFVVRVAHRAGNANRDYKSSLYRVRDKQEDKDYYFVGELATPLLTMFETYYFGLANLQREELYTERDAFYVSLNAILSHAANEECHQQYKLLFWHTDPGTHKANSVGLYDYLLPVIKEELRCEKDSELDRKLDLKKAASHKVANLQVDSAEDGQLQTFEPVLVRGYNPAAVYESSKFKYDLDVANDERRGHCLIINMRTFDKGRISFQPRSGAGKDVENVEELFKSLHFICQVHEDLTLPNLWKLLLTTSLADHSAYKAFVCVFMTHGRLGVLYTSDAQPVNVIDVAEYFNDTNCPSLRGKPKMFFIQACQRGVEQNRSPSTTGEQTAAGSVSENSVGLVPVYQVDSGRGTGNNSLELSVEPSAVTDVNTLVDVQSQENDVADVVDETARKEAASNDAPASVVSFASVEPVIQEDAAKASLEWDANIAPTLQAADERGLTWYTGKALLIPSWPDFLMSYATLPGAAAYRDIESGSLYINFLCKYLKKRMEIDRALKKVTGQVSKFLKAMPDAGTVHRFQLPFHLTSGMDKLIYL